MVENYLMLHLQNHNSQTTVFQQEGMPLHFHILVCAILNTVQLTVHAGPVPWLLHSLDLKGCIVHSSSACRCCWDAAVYYRGDKWGGLWYFCGKWEELDCHWDMAGSACWPPVDSIRGIFLYKWFHIIVVFCISTVSY